MIVPTSRDEIAVNRLRIFGRRGVKIGVFSIRRIAVKHFQALDTFDYFCHSRALSSLRDQLFGSVQNLPLSLVGGALSELC